MNRIPQSFLQDLIARTDIVELIQARVKLTKRGQNYQGLCPFHNEKSPSFTVSEIKQFYHCFGCGANGNAISFLIAYDRMDFLDAVEELAAKHGLEVPKSKSSSHDIQSSHLEDYTLLEKISQYYQQNLRKAPNAINYLKSRGLSGHTAKRFAIGYATDSWDDLTDTLATNEQEKQRLFNNGLLVKKDSGRVFNRFRNRIMFPIRDTRGRVIAFGGRVLNNDQPKYMNSPETPLFHKSKELYGLYEALQQNRKLEQILIVEGYMDVVSLQQQGVTNAVATLGTASNPGHLQKLLRHTQEIIFCFDGDNAGRQAAWKALIMSLPILRDGINIRFIFLPEGDDPDSLIQRIGQQGFLQRLEKALPLNQVFFDHLKEEIPLNSPANKASFAKQAATHLNTMPNGLFKELLLEELASTLHVYKNDLNQLATKTTFTKEPLPNKKTGRLVSPAYHACNLLLCEPKLALEASELDNLTSTDLPGTKLLITLVQHLKSNPQQTVGELLTQWEDEDEKRRISELAARELSIPLTGMLSEFKGAIARLLEQSDNALAEQLIEKAKTTELSQEEKKLLQKLLTKQHKIPI